jgi:hypothetical protein
MLGREANSGLDVGSGEWQRVRSVVDPLDPDNSGYFWESALERSAEWKQYPIDNFCRLVSGEHIVDTVKVAESHRVAYN